VLVHRDGTRFAVLASDGHADEEVTLKTVLPHGEGLSSLDDEAVVDTVTMGPFDIKVFETIGS
jgi:hypothetical protein